MSDINAIFWRLRSLDERMVAAGTNSHDRVHALMNACITEGVDTGSRIVGTLARLGYNRHHVGIVLNAGLRAAPERPNWGRTAEGVYFAPPQALPRI